MLGDGCIYRYRPTQLPHLSITRAARDFDYLAWQAHVFAPFMQHGLAVYPILDKRTGRTYQQARLVTRSARVFVNWRETWYPEGVKELPAQIELSPLALAVWFADDGSISASSSKGKKGLLTLKFATHGFRKPDVERLARLLGARYDAYFGLIRDGGNWYIWTSDIGARRFIDEVDSVLPEGMERKAYWRRPDVIADGRSRASRSRPERERLAALAEVRYAKLGSLTAVGRELGITPSTVRAWLRSRGAWSPDPQLVRSPEERELMKTEAVALYETLHSCAKVATVLGVSERTAVVWLHESGVELLPRWDARRARNVVPNELAR